VNHNAVIDSFAHELAEGDVLVVQGEHWRVLGVARLTPGLVHVYTDRDTLTLPANVLVEIIGA
jgi:hypothetical protein